MLHKILEQNLEINSPLGTAKDELNPTPSKSSNKRYLSSEIASSQQQGSKLSEVFNLNKYHSEGLRGHGIKIAVFDSGLAESISKNQESTQDSEVLKTKRIINFTHDKDSDDSLGHGTFISGVVGSLVTDCGGIA